MFRIPFLDLPPLRAVQGRVQLPGSKSISNRVLLLAALSAGRTVIHDLLDSDDTRVMLAALRQLGCAIETSADAPHRVAITGLGGQGPDPAAPLALFLGNAGTAMRPLTAALALLGVPVELSGVARMHERPIGDLVEALRQLGCRIDYLGNPGYPPLRIERHGPLALEHPIQVRGDVSSQFLTALLLALPLVAQQHAITIEVVGELISKPYIDITLKLLARFGIAVARDGWQRFVIPAGSHYRSPGEIHVEADASSASYFIALGALAATAPGLRIQGVGHDSIQGDIRFVEAAQAMGAQIHSGRNWLDVARGAWPLKAIDLDCNHIPDAAMTLAMLALYADGPSTLRNIASWRVKETDRIDAMAAELRKLGATVEDGPDFIRIHPLPAGAWRDAAIHTYDDHRVAMCFSLAAFNPDQRRLRILDPQCVGKTFPDYFEALFGIAQAQPDAIPVLCIDGPTASGKGTLTTRVAGRLGYHHLDSGSLYRLTALEALRRGTPLSDGVALGEIARHLPVRFEGDTIWLDGVEVSEAIRAEIVGNTASRISALPEVRQGLYELQHSFRRLPGLVADGRDMGTVIFPDAALKVFLTASAAKRADRRYKQLISKGIPAILGDLRADLEARDARDTQRSTAPLKPAAEALLLDNSDLTVDASIEQVLAWWQQRQPAALQ